MARVGRITGNPDQIEGCVEIYGLAPLIEQGDLVLPGHEAGEVRHGQLREVVELPPPERADERVLRCDEQDFHRHCSAFGRVRLAMIRPQHRHSGSARLPSSAH
jgi:hypothetical protein